MLVLLLSEQPVRFEVAAELLVDARTEVVHDRARVVVHADLAHIRYDSQIEKQHEYDQHDSDYFSEPLLARRHAQILPYDIVRLSSVSAWQFLAEHFYSSVFT